ncbi:2,3-bisphosphoglycerate-dependent phosphoglycerate mutase [Pseudomonas sp. ZM23]|jgi:2,3-bisphosphoglycerate-dependent phosphoglycerate mutase|uniref:2,3-bisphosphoglycerate-dependent phosphoglycerate mutase n=3 Tax=Pseudomonadota TaxID=1224 RepID=A0AAW7T133_BURVI|nr:MULTISPECIES: 2,3-bisphosphoglycerate-dependent phosphoglycerate mutase [Pseudomonadota]MCP8477257.1 2,3-bisphosphoglycerate-dependent phosphoglycerate mutase [Pseudomonas triclosanedens]HEJ6533365.1 2,3-bisphosphoglycerate-dependent phosphoglycerate mutase [Pseudomonas aeruginosa]MCP8465958.1 2,3-bisphosphoglycerate-dependent phosphoglycerate mutase [Pseudomonas triclosanedens]MDN7796045.1 2,3-bisphosphoglycerate-dependent phosphoglycerate mutase [Burkholderia vietnamiensis]WAI47405.1 2,3-
MTGYLILLRHGESEWNREQRFTGWVDVDLTSLGRTQMREAACAMREAGIEVDIAFASVLKRCVYSLWIALDEMERFWIPQKLDWRLNERHYGGLTGLSRRDAECEFGAARVMQWRRSIDIVPPPVGDRVKSLVALDERYRGCPVGRAFQGESLRQTMERVREVWVEELVPLLCQGRSVLLVGHGNALRALIGLVEKLDDDKLSQVEIANGTPIIYGFDETLAPKSKRVFDAGSRTPSEIL